MSTSGLMTSQARSDVYVSTIVSAVEKFLAPQAGWTWGKP